MEDALTVTTPSEAIEGGTEQRVVEGGVIRERLDYVDFLRVRGMVSDKALPFLTSSTFMRCRTVCMATVGGRASMILRSFQ